MNGRNLNHLKKSFFKIVFFLVFFNYYYYYYYFNCLYYYYKNIAKLDDKNMNCGAGSILEISPYCAISVSLI